MAGVSIPLLAIEAGHPGWVVGLITSVGAAVQLSARLPLPRLMRRFTDKHLMLFAVTALIASCTLAACSAQLWSLLASLGLQGLSRAFFWTAGQTHAVRAADDATRRMAAMNVANGAGMLIGPLLAGLISATSPALALAVAAAIAALVLIPTATLSRFAPFAAASRRKGRLLGGLGKAVGVAGWMNTVAGAQRALLTSWVPIILAEAGESATMVGASIAVANLAALAGGPLAPWLRRFGVARAGALCAAAVGLAVIAFGLGANTPAVVVIALGVSGLGSGVLQTLGPAYAADSVPPERRGDAITASGTYRAVSMTATPLFVSAAVAILPVGWVLAVLGAGIALGTIALRTPHQD